MINHPSQFDPREFGTLRFWLGPPEEWPGEVREDIGLAIFAARNWGYECLCVAHEADSDFSIRWADSGAVDGWAGLWTPSQRLIQIDYEKAHGRYERRRSILHEIGHAFGCDHVAVPTALMFEALGKGDPEIGFGTYGGNLATDFVTQADIDEFNRVRALGRAPTPRRT